MQSKAFRGVRHLLVSTGVITLVLSVAAPAAMADSDPRGGAEDNKQWVCVPTGSDSNPWEFNLVSVAAEGSERHLVPDQDGFDWTRKVELENELEEDVDGALLQRLTTACEAAADLAGDDVDGDGGNGGGSDDTTNDDDDNAGGNLGGGSDEANDDDAGGNGGGNDGGNGGSDDADADHDDDDNDGGDNNSNAGGTNGGVEGEDGDGPGQSDGQHGGGNTDETGDVDVDTPAVVEDTDTGAEGTGSTAGNGATPAVPATPAQPIPVVEPRPVVVISTDTVTAPATPATPAAPPTPDRGSEVLGAVTTRTPTPGVGALDPGAQTVGAITALAATGSGSTTVLAIVGLLLLLAGFGLQIGARRRIQAAQLGA